MIELGFPWGLLALLALPVIVVLHLLRPRRERLVLSATWLWQEALRERQRGLGLHKLLSDLGLLLLLAAALLMALGLSNPLWLRHAAEGEDTVLVIDTSASMGTRSASGTRFAQALEVAENLLGELAPGGRMLLMSSASKALLRSGFETDRVTLQRALAGLRVTAEAGRPRPALALALSLLRNREAGRVVFVSDGAFDPEQRVDSPRIDYRIVGAPARNLAITRFDFRPEIGREDRFQVLLTVRNYTDQAVRAAASVTLERRPLFSRELALAPGGTETLVLPFEGQAVGRARARVEVEDDLDTDNHAYAVVNVPEPLRVALASPGNFFLDNVLAALPRVQVTRLGDLDAITLARASALHDVVILDRVPAPALGRGSFLLVDTLPPGLPFADAGTVHQPVILGSGDSVLVKDVDLGAVRIDRARRVRMGRAEPGLQSLFWSADSELAIALLRGELRIVYLGFDLARSNFPLQAAFPLFVSNSLDWLHPRDPGFASTQLPAGDSYAIRVPADDAEVIVRLPSGEGQTQRAAGGQVLFDDTSDAGVYRYSVAGVARYFAVNLTDVSESDVNARIEAPARPAADRDARAGAPISFALWPYLAIAALVVLVLEWTLWCLRAARA